MSLLELPGRLTRTAQRAAHGISYRRPPTLRGAISQPCTYDQVTSPEYVEWCRRLNLPPLSHRKLWEWCYILEVLEAAGVMQPDRTGLGFGVGTEPITAYIANRGAHIVATDLPAEAERAAEWGETEQHADQLADLNGEGHCPPDDFAERVSFRPVDMNHIPADLARREFDFTWSSCAMEHLGDLAAGLDFFEHQLACLKPGGVGVHTTEFAIEDDEPTLETGHTVLYRRRDLEQLTQRIRAQGHKMRITFALGARPEDLHVDLEPYTDIHIRTETLHHVHTSFGLVVRKA